MSRPSFARLLRRLGPIALAVTATDCATKRVAERTLSPNGFPHDVVGDVVRFRLAYNNVGAMGITFGDWSRPILVACTFVILFVLIRWYQQLQTAPRWVAAGLALVLGGAFGNLGDRVFARQGVVDFIDIGIGIHRFWIFNVADIAVTVGAALLAVATMHSATHETHQA